MFKLTDTDGRTYNDTQWGPNVTHKTNGKGGMCGPGWLHVYTHPLLAVLLNPIHANFENPRLWEAESGGKTRTDGLKVGVTKLTTIREIPLPVVTPEHRLRFAILCAKRVCDDTDWNHWADRWLSGEDQSEAAAKEAAWSAKAAEAALASQAAVSLSSQAAAKAAAWSAKAAKAAAWSAKAEGWAALQAAGWAAAWSAKASGWSAAAAEEAILTDPTIDLAAIAEEACSN